MQALVGLWIAASLLAGIHAVWLLLSTRTRLAAVGRAGAPTFEIGGKRATPYVACLAVPAMIWLAWHAFAAGAQ
jgi:prepilin peptidase CpaA